MSRLADLLRQHRASIQIVSVIASNATDGRGAFQGNAKMRQSTGFTVCYNDDPEAAMIEAVERSIRTLEICGGVSGLKTQSKSAPKPKPSPVEDDEDLLGDDEDLLGEDDEEDLLG